METQRETKRGQLRGVRGPGEHGCGCPEALGPAVCALPAHCPPHHTERTSSSLRACGSLPSSTQKKPDVPLAPAVRTSSSEWVSDLGGAGVRPAAPRPPGPPPAAPRGTPVPEEAHLLAAEPCHPGVGARGAQQAPRALRLIKHGEPRIPGADLHCRATGQPPGSPTRQSPPRLVSLLGGLALNPCRPDQRARGPPTFVTASGQVQSKIRGPGTSCPARNQGTFSCLVDS